MEIFIECSFCGFDDFIDKSLLISLFLVCLGLKVDIGIRVR